jgi:hypothetical protein
MNSVLLSVLISVFFILGKMVIHYKESPSPNIKDGILVFLSSIATLYGAQQYVLKPKVTEVFTEKPPF